MFTDSPATPTRLEVLVELVWEMRQRKLDRDAIRKLLQPKGLPDLGPKSNQAMETLTAARELGVVTEDQDGNIRPGWNVKKAFNSNAVVLAALDEKVLKSTEVESYFALFYAYLITKEDDTAPPGDAGERWSNDFNRDMYGGRPEGRSNPFNKVKYKGLRAWMRYSGLGWHDAQDTFIPNPYHRIKRRMEEIFEGKKKIDCDIFMSNLAVACPELDGGAIFREANRDLDLHRTCTRALAVALRDLHDNRVVKLTCPADSRGWSLIRAGVIRNPLEDLHSDSFDFIERLAQAEDGSV
jgi:hypothetical protein